MRFTLTIELGNAAMMTGEHVAAALKSVAEWIDDDTPFTGAEDGESIRDINGNRVGGWSVHA